MPVPMQCVSRDPCRNDALFSRAEAERQKLTTFVRRQAVGLETYLDIEDIVQTVYVQAWQYLPTFRGQCDIVSWVYNIAANLIRNLRQSRKMLPSAAEIPEVSAFDKPFRDYEYRQVRKAMKHLPPLYEEILLLKANDWTMKEIGEMQGCSVMAVKSRLWRGRQMLQKILDSASD